MFGGRGARCFGGSAGPLLFCAKGGSAASLLAGATPNLAVVATVRYRCTSCGNLTRFDVTSSRRVKAFHHYTVGGELSVEDVEVLDESVESVECRWCGPSGHVEEIDPAEAVTPPA